MAGEQRSLWADPGHLQSVQYRDDANLAARQAIYACQRPRLDLYGTVLDLAGPRGDELVLDVGCGNGAYLAALAARGHRGAAVGVDFSPGMLVAARRAAPSARLLCGDARSLPLAEGAAGVVLAAHMLYHLPEPWRAVQEMRRVLGRGGRAAVVLNGSAHLWELREAMAQTASNEAYVCEPAGVERLRLDDGERLLHAAFPAVTRTDFDAELVVEDRAVLEAYAASMLSSSEPHERASLAAAVADSLLDRDGVARIRTQSGCLVAT